MSKKPRWGFDSDHKIAQVESMAGLRLTMVEMAAIFGVSESTIERAFKKSATAREALERGRILTSHNVRLSAYKMATSGEYPAMTMFWLKTQEGWRETTRLELSGANGEPINHVLQLTPEQRRAKINEFNDLMSALDQAEQPIFEEG